MRRVLVLGAVALLGASAAVADDFVRHPVNASIRRGSIRRVIVDIPAGEIMVRNGAGDRISLSGEVQRRYDGFNQREREQRIVNDINLEIFVDEDDALIRRKFGPEADSWRARTWHTSYRLTIEVPRGMGLDLETKYGEVTLEGDFGNVSVDLRAGEIHLRTPRSSVRELNASVRIGEVHTDFGEEREDHEGILPGTTHFINANGRSRINVHTTVGELHVTLTK
jgi:hypothetical protein